MNKPWRFRNETGQAGVAELFIYGDIEDYKWLDEDVTAEEFARDLAGLGQVTEIVVRINSGGGSVFAATAIASLLTANDARILVKIDGIAASAATIIAMAGDEISIPVNAMMMIHDPLLRLYGAYNELKLEDVVKTLQEVKRALVEGYRARTGLSEEEIAQIMRDETWLTGRDAVEKGFADILIEDRVAASLSGQVLNINGQDHDLEKYKQFPKAQFEPQAGSLGVVAKVQSPTQQPKSPSNSVEEPPVASKPKEDETVTQEEIRNKHPEIYNAIMNEGVTAERNRMKDFEQLSNHGHQELINKAKFETGSTAAECALQMIAKDKTLGSQELENQTEDAKVLNSVESDKEPQSDEDKVQARAERMAKGSRR